MKHPTEKFTCLVWNIFAIDANKLDDQEQRIELSGSIFVKQGLSHTQDNQLQLSNFNIYDPQYEDILLRSYDQLVKQNESELNVESSENYKLLNKEALNV